MRKRALRVLSGFVGLAFIVLGFVGSGFSILAMIDPVGTKAADDNDPLGLPPSFLEVLGVLGLYCALGALGVYLLWLFARRRTPQT